MTVYAVLLALVVAFLCVACFVFNLCSFFFFDPNVSRKDKVRAGWAICCSFAILSVARYPELNGLILVCALVVAFIGILWASSPMPSLLFERMLVALHKLFFPDGYLDESVGPSSESNAESAPRGEVKL